MQVLLLGGLALEQYLHCLGTAHLVAGKYDATAGTVSRADSGV